MRSQKTLNNKKRNKKKVVILIAVAVFVVAGFFAFSYMKNNKKTLAINSISLLDKVSGILPISDDKKKEIEVLNKLVEKFTAENGEEYTFLFMLQNNMELRPGGGFLGQYAVVDVKDGEITSLYLEDANLLDQRINYKVAAPYPFKQLMGIKNWKFRDSNFSPDFPTNVEKAKYFYRLSGRSSTGFDGVIAVNATVLNDVLEITGPITVPGWNVEFNSENAVLKLEEVVERPYLMNPDLDTQNRKAIMKSLAPMVAEKAMSIGNLKKMADLVHEEFENKNIMINFEDSELQRAIEDVHWDGSVNEDWTGDYLMVVDANMGALKSDYFIDRSISYDLDFTQEKPLVTLKVLYEHNATYGDWRTSDYHSYVRMYVPQGSNLIDRKMVSYPLVDEDFGKTYFGFKVDVIMNNQTEAIVTYELPETVSEENYRLLVQKQSGVGDVPIKIHVKTSEEEFDYEDILKKDLELELKN